MKITKSPNFAQGFNTGAMTRQINKNINLIGERSAKLANKIAPIDTSATKDKTVLRRSLKTRQPYNKFIIRWDIENPKSNNFKYAGLRYFNNNKNPQTKEWAKQAHKLNEAINLATMMKGVIK